MAAIEGEWPTIPADVIGWFQRIFAEANLKISETLVNVPATRETSLDDLFIASLMPHQAVRSFKSGTVVRLDVHNIGGLRHYENWEVADIGLVAHVIQSKRIIASKVALLQSKRLFPVVGDVEPDDRVDFGYGINKWLKRDPAPTTMAITKDFTFDDTSRYRSLQAGSDQVHAIDRYSEKLGDSAIYYLMYNPARVPTTIKYPITARKVLKLPPRIGARVYRAAAIHDHLADMGKGQSPTFGQVFAETEPAGGWRVEDWASKEFLKCRVGRRFSSKEDEIIASVIQRRSGPIAAAIQVSIELPRG